MTRQSGSLGKTSAGDAPPARVWLRSTLWRLPLVLALSAAPLAVQHWPPLDEIDASGPVFFYVLLILATVVERPNRVAGLFVLTHTLLAIGVWQSVQAAIPGEERLWHLNALRLVDLPIFLFIENLDGWPRYSPTHAVVAALLAGGPMYGLIGWAIARFREKSPARPRFTLLWAFILIGLAAAIWGATRRPPDGLYGAGGASVFFGGLLVVHSFRSRPLMSAILFGLLHVFLAAGALALVAMRDNTMQDQWLVPLYLADPPLVPLFETFDGFGTGSLTIGGIPIIDLNKSGGVHWHESCLLTSQISLVAGSLIYAAIGLVLGILGKRRSSAETHAIVATAPISNRGWRLPAAALAIALAGLWLYSFREIAPRDELRAALRELTPELEVVRAQLLLDDPVGARRTADQYYAMRRGWANDAYAVIAVYQAADGDLASAEQTARQTRHPEAAVDALCEIALAWRRSGDRDRGLRRFNEAWALIEAEQFQTMPPDPYFVIAQALGQAGYDERAREVVRLGVQAAERDARHEHAVPCLLAASRVSQALGDDKEARLLSERALAASQTGDPLQQLKLLRAIADREAELGDLSDVATVIEQSISLRESFEHDGNKLYARACRAVLALIQLRHGDPEEAAMTMAAAFDNPIIDSGYDDCPHEEARFFIAEQLANGDLEASRELVERLDATQADCSEYWAMLAIAYRDLGQFDEALAMVERIEKAADRATIGLQIAIAVARSGDKSRAAEIAAAIDRLNDESLRFRFADPDTWGREAETDFMATEWVPMHWDTDEWDRTIAAIDLYLALNGSDPDLYERVMGASPHFVWRVAANLTEAGDLDGSWRWVNRLHRTLPPVRGIGSGITPYTSPGRPGPPDVHPIAQPFQHGVLGMVENLPCPPGAEARMTAARRTELWLDRWRTVSCSGESGVLTGIPPP